jgi:hypothetical protein
MTSVAPGRTSATASLGRAAGPRSSSLTTTRSARARNGCAAGASRATSLVAATWRSKPCQPSATRVAPVAAVAQPAPSSPAIGARTRAPPGVPRPQPGGSDARGSRSAAETQCWRRPEAISTFSKTGPLASSTRTTSAPARRRRSSSVAFEASASAPTSARVDTPRRASVSPAYETAPPSRQPRGSSDVRSREAAPTTSAVSCRAQSLLPGDPVVLL